MEQLPRATLPGFLIWRLGNQEKIAALDTPVNDGDRVEIYCQKGVKKSV
jgi:molybdopterin converting factor small subunit